MSSIVLQKEDITSYILKRCLPFCPYSSWGLSLELNAEQTLLSSNGHLIDSRWLASHSSCSADYAHAMRPLLLRGPLCFKLFLKPLLGCPASLPLIL